MIIMVGIDMHVKTLVCEIGIGKKKPRQKTYSNDYTGYLNLIHYIEEAKRIHNATGVLVAYEASGLGYVFIKEIWYKKTGEN